METDDDFPMNDEQLLQTVTRGQLEELCLQLHLPINGTKADMLTRLRQHADTQADLETKRRRERVARVEEGSNGESKERYEIIEVDNYFENESQEEDEEDQGYFFFELPKISKERSNETSSNPGVENDGEQKGKGPHKKKKQKPSYVTQNDIIAAPPPPENAKLNENGERVVTVYSTTDQNDLTGVAAAQPGQAAMSGTDAMVAGSGSSQPQPWDMERGQTKAATSKEIEEAKEKVTELVQTLLAMSNAPGFRDYDMPDELEDIVKSSYDDDDYASSSMSGFTNRNSRKGTDKFVGFDPSKVPTHILTEASQSLRANRGRVLQDVLREFELNAVGQDGMHGDNVDDGGGHFREVSKVRAFLEGYRRAEVRKAARLTATLLLDKLVSEGIDGLDMTLATMSRSSDDSASADDAYELNDSLISYLSDAIRQQEKKVDQLRGPEKKAEEAYLASVSSTLDEEDPVESLWNRTTDEDGTDFESIDPSDKRVKKVLQEEYEKSEASASNMKALSIPESAPEKLLLLLTLLRERVKTEAAFPNDERSRNLRLLAYCLQCSNAANREELIMKNLGNSIDGLDSFLELVASSIEYAESTSYQLKPTKGMPLNVKLLRSIHDLTENIREQQAWEASGLKP